MSALLLSVWVWDTLNVEGVPWRFFEVQGELYLITTGDTPSVYIYTKNGVDWSLLASYTFSKPLVKTEAYNGELWFWLDDTASALFIRQVSPGELDTVTFTYTDEYREVYSFWVDSTGTVGIIIPDTALPYGYLASFVWNGSQWVKDTIEGLVGIDTDGKFGKSLFFGGRAELSGGMGIMLLRKDTSWHIDTVHFLPYDSGDYFWSPVHLKVDPQGNPALFHTGFLPEYNWMEEGEWRTSYADCPVRVGEDTWDFDTAGHPWFLGPAEDVGIRLVNFVDGQWIPSETIYRDTTDTSNYFRFQGIAIDESDVFHVILGNWPLPGDEGDTVVLYGYGVPQDAEENPAEPSLRLIPLLGGSKLAFKLSVSKAGRYSLKLYDAQGRLVRKLFEGELAPGWHEVGLGVRLPRGVYFLSLWGEGLRADIRFVSP